MKNIQSSLVILALRVCALLVALAFMTMNDSTTEHTFAASANSSLPSASTPIDQLLKSDGTLDLSTGFSGSLDVRGWQMGTDQKGVPHFSRVGSNASESNAPAMLAALPNDGWDNQFGVPPGGNGADYNIYAVYVSGNYVYAGGGFTHVGNIAANRIAVWDGTGWFALANGLDGDVYAIAWNGGKLYAAGGFTNVCGNAACTSGNTIVNNIAVYSCVVLTCFWSPLSNGLHGQIETMTSYLNQLYVGGEFDIICGNSACSSGNRANNVAVWNGSNWSALGYGFSNGFVFSLAIYGGNLYAGGQFNLICGNPTCTSSNTSVNHLAEFNGSNWVPFTFGFNGDIITLVSNGNKLYAGGAFTAYCLDAFCLSSLSANRIAIWDGVGWNALGNGVDNSVHSLALSGNDLYLGGDFINACGNYLCSSGNLPMNHIAKWDGRNFIALGSGVNASAYALGTNGIQVFVGGIFTTAGNQPSNYFGHWDKTYLYLPLIMR